ncbi:rhomboid family intramembrane serine protease [Candidatus Acetothermia bacterium]|jgi:membrane associated rhomboid family serine protease|nr:rhomboid family intramembrane serine protease [Candidatus Acetothermia bacterium]MCI2426514.1 rhomboid family intramembrane serine protease [Candidatus Acetothermia bacterium]MCI2427790.1 rhomboid family intramembrane serine protease [Candidatus Acetothermia bacterium]MCI2428279.1 rhomboid family intramembrane serine protease [Candidatus Acetothermia bacterium]
MIPIRDYRRSSHFPLVTVTLIIVNLLVFFYQSYLERKELVLNDARPWLAHGFETPPAFNPDTYRLHRLRGGDRLMYPVTAADYFILQFGLISGELLNRIDLPPASPFPLILTIFTSAFLHGGLLHLLGNMLYLWIFGDNVEDAMGRVKFFLFYLLCGVGAAAAQIFSGPPAAIPMIGASGAIAGVLGAYLVLFPRSQILTLIPIFFFIRLIYLPAILLLGLWFLLQIFSAAIGGAQAGGVAWLAHIGGFVVGILLVFGFKRRGFPVGLFDIWQSNRW